MKVLKPNDLGEAQHMMDDGAIPVGGATVLAQQREKRDLIDLSQLYELKQLTIDEDVIRIGALTTIEQIARHHKIRQLAPALAQAADAIGSPQSRRMGTIGGNIALYIKGELPTADLIPALGTLRSKIYFASGEATMVVKLHASDWRSQLITHIDVPIGAADSIGRSAFWKFGNRTNGGSAIPVVNCAVTKTQDLVGFSIGGLASRVVFWSFLGTRWPNASSNHYDAALMNAMLRPILTASKSPYKQSLACYGVWECLREINAHAD